MLLREPWQQGIKARLDIANGSDGHRIPSPNVGGISINLYDLRAIRIELSPGKIRAKHQQNITVKDGVIASRPADNAGHPDIVGVVVFDEVLAAGCVRHWRLEPRRRGDHLVVGSGAASASIDCNCLAGVENFGDLVEVRVAWAKDRAPHMNGIGPFVVRGRVRDIYRHNEDSDAPFRQCRLASCDSLAAGLLWSMDHVTENTAASIDIDEIDLLNRLEAQVLARDLACDQDDGRAVAIGLVKSVNEVEAAGTT